MTHYNASSDWDYHRMVNADYDSLSDSDHEGQQDNSPPSATTADGSYTPIINLESSDAAPPSNNDSPSLERLEPNRAVPADTSTPSVIASTATKDLQSEHKNELDGTTNTEDDSESRAATQPYSDSDEKDVTKDLRVNTTNDLPTAATAQAETPRPLMSGGEDIDIIAKATAIKKALPEYDGTHSDNSACTSCKDCKSCKGTGVVVRTVRAAQRRNIFCDILLFILCAVFVVLIAAGDCFVQYDEKLRDGGINPATRVRNFVKCKLVPPPDHAGRQYVELKPSGISYHVDGQVVLFTEMLGHGLGELRWTTA